MYLHDSQSCWDLFLFLIHTACLCHLSDKVLCIVIYFLVLCFIRLSSSLVHFKNSPAYLTMKIVQVFIPFLRFLLQTLVSRSFLILPRFSFLIFFFISICPMVSVTNILKYLQFSFSPNILTPNLVFWLKFGDPLVSQSSRKFSCVSFFKTDSDLSIYNLIVRSIISRVKMATVVEGDPKAPFSIATTLRCRGGHYSFSWIAPLYPWCVSYNAEC